MKNKSPRTVQGINNILFSSVNNFILDIDLRDKLESMGKQELVDYIVKLKDNKEKDQLAESYSSTRNQ